MKIDKNKYPCPRKKVIRSILRTLINIVFAILGDFEIIGEENLPQHGPLLVVGNHFSFLDPLAMIKITSWKLEFLGGTRTPNAPGTVEWLRHLWGIIPVFRGSVSRDTFVISETVLAQMCCGQLDQVSHFWQRKLAHKYYLLASMASILSLLKFENLSGLK
jgi:hypothetical protein